MKRVIYFTHVHNCPTSSHWIEKDVEAMARHFDEVIVAPFLDDSHEHAVNLPDGVRVLPPLLQPADCVFSPRHLLRLLNRRLPAYLKALQTRPPLRPLPWTKWATACLIIEAALRSRTFQHELLPLLPDAALCFLWGIGYVDLLPFLPANRRTSSLVRFHGYDLYAERNQGWIPFQGTVASAASMLAPISQHGARYLAERYPDRSKDIVCLRLGTQSKGVAHASNDGIFRLVSCSFVNPVKRVDLIARALTHVNRPVHWTHIGDGAGLDQIQALTAKMPPHVQCHFAGRIPAAEVQGIYSGQPFDLFINVSSSEGVPVSIMEALGAGIPVLATSVGGTPEIVDSSVGKLLPDDLTEESLAKEIEAFASMSAHQITEMRIRCRERQARDFDSKSNAERLATTLLQLHQQPRG